MPEFIVCVREVHVQMVKVEADTADQAKERVREGEGDYVDNSLEYSHTLDPALWTVDEVKKDG